MNAKWTVLSNLILPALLAVVAGVLWKPAALIVTGIYTIGGVITVLFVERDGGEHPLIVFTGWYSGPLLCITELFRLR